jgi:leucyl-tRNA synthetase
MEYDFRRIEKHWQRQWEASRSYKVSNESSKPRYYVLDMFPYPSGAGLHVGHPLGYIASDIYARYKRLKGFNVLHPMGYDAFGLPAEQYAIDHGIHPAVSTEQNITNFRKQLDNIGFCFDWDREINTSDPSYYKWTQWIFLQLFDSFYNRETDKAERVGVLTELFEKEGNKSHPCPGDATLQFSADEWENFEEQRKMDVLMQYRLAYCGYGEVNWCEALGTVLANDEVINGVSERGGYPVVKKKLRQWYLRITEYAERLLEGLERIEFSEAMKEMQTNWIGKSSGAEIDFEIAEPDGGWRIADGGPAVPYTLRVYTTRPDTIFGVDFMVIAPEHELVGPIASEKQKTAVEEYIAYVKSRSERERMAEKKISGVFTGAYALNPFNGRKIPVWISEYVLAGYGTGAIMGVPCGDERDHKFARHFGIPITNIIGAYYNGEEANPTKDAVLENSDFLDGMLMRDAIDEVINRVEEKGIGVRKVNYKMRDAAFSRQRYWGEPIPVKWMDGVAYPLPETGLPLELPHVDSYKPGPDGEGPLANIPEWTAKNLETNTMPGYAGSSWYFLRYMDPHNDKVFCDRKVSDYWNQVDVYIGGTEHAVGHLLYSRMWTKALYDLDYIGFDEPYKKLVNQGMIQGVSSIATLIIYTPTTQENKAEYLIIPPSIQSKEGYTDLARILLHVPIEYIQYREGIQILTKENLEKLKRQSPNSLFAKSVIGNSKNILECPESESIDLESVRGLNDEYVLVDSIIEKMSKSKFNVVNPDDIINKYGADTFRMYEMFLGPVEMSKPWDTKGIEGVHRFLKKFWRLFMDETRGLIVTDDLPTAGELKTLHKAIKKIEDDTARFSFNTGVSSFMIATNELTDLECHKRAVLEPLLILLVPYAPHIAEELWRLLGHTDTILDAAYPVFEEKHVKESSKAYPVAINGKTRAELTLALDATQQEVEEMVLADTTVQKWLDGKQPKRIIYVKNKMINVVV